MVDIWELYEKTENGCDKKCDACSLWLKQKKTCLHDDNKRWQEWARKQHDEVAELLRIYE